ncbi:AtzE family amidohydrolase [Phormidium tenue]|uniref:Amidase n=1 Tax=Phormidium tenue NIES-30 TaxID=549789 RepID=A0A1U7J3H7_9CYAN|nr:AtzE family amidohydrolase [Phormidium tenue]MBD2233328.1 AtzE family amidohydrolase [Phormidium tenue FACHB-1052]OKH46794.1 amidase [Phormidium tenue NIES-30]
MTQPPDALALAAAIKARRLSAVTVLEAMLADIARRNPALNCFTAVTVERARSQAQAIDDAIAAGKDPGPLAGVPFAVKNLFDVEGITTVAGAKLNQKNPPAAQDATVVARLKQAGAVLVGALNMDEYAYGFVTINAHFGTTPNPHDPSRMSGGSSGGSAAAIAAGLVPFTLGSDTNGSIRVPASLCGVYGLKPTYGRLSRAGAFLFSSSLDHVGPLARSLPDLATIYDIMQGPDSADPVCTQRPPEPVATSLTQGIEGLRIAQLGGHFERGMEPLVRDILTEVLQVLSVSEAVEFPETHRARAAAYIITACEGSQLHLDRLRQSPMEFDPATRDRFLAGAMLPAAWYLQAQRLRRWYRDRVREIFQHVDVLITPTTPCVAPPLDQTTLEIDGELYPLRPHLGFYTQPLSFIGLPVLSVPIHRPGQLPVGIQLIAAPYQEANLFRVAAQLERRGVGGRG